MGRTKRTKGRMISQHLHRWRRIGLGGLCALGIIAVLSSTSAQAVSLFFENFEGFLPTGNENLQPGLPRISEGAQEIWYGGRFEASPGDSIDDDLSVRRNVTNTNRNGRMEDEAGMLFRLDTVGYTNVQLDFQWRVGTAAETNDRFVAMYTTADLGTGFGPCTGEGEAGCFQDFSNGLMAWTEIVRLRRPAWQSVTNYLLPGGQSHLWVAFWMDSDDEPGADSGEGDFGLFDNVRVTANSVTPEPGTLLLVGSGMVGLGLWRKRRLSGRQED